MAIASRHGGAPFADGETLSGTDLETDFANVYAQVNGNLDNSNVANNAGIDGTKLLTNSIPATKLVSSSIALSKLAAASVSKYALTYATTSDAIANSGAGWHSVEGINAQTIVPGNIGDLVVCYFQGTVTHVGATQTRMQARFSVGGVASDVSGAVDVSGGRLTLSTLWAFAATSTGSLSIQPQYNQVIGETGTWGSRLFLALVIPVKV